MREANEAWRHFEKAKRKNADCDETGCFRPAAGISSGFQKTKTHPLRSRHEIANPISEALKMK
jgi:hypothetical protein